MARARIEDAAGSAAVGEVRAALAADETAPRPVTAMAVRWLLQVLADGEPGATVEVRVPPFGAVQFREGLSHTRGTPPNVVETDAATFVRLATGDLSWQEARAGALVSASGSRADLTCYVPIAWQRG
ncbi:sterol carrier family protein [Frigoribacterium faeni]|uniref:sterol carrier family protein n=1 Tax=Frigoribacterium faeni TaxID=145483 RepID=UPI00241385C1|nr:sterol carrier family protein [Frigoribacterium faeni]